MAKRKSSIARNIRGGAIKYLVSKERSFFAAIPALLWQILFLYVPLVFIIFVSFLKDIDSSIWNNFSFNHYRELFSPIYFQIWGRSLSLAFVTSVFCLIIAYPIAYFLVFRVRKMRNVLLFLLVLPFWTNFLVQVYAWFFVLERGGILNSALLRLGLISEPLRILNTQFSVYLVMLFCFVPFMVMPIYSSMEKINKSVFEASLDLGATRWQTLTRVIMPLCSSGIRTGFFLVFIPSFGEFVVPLLLGGGRDMFVGSLISFLFLETRSTEWGAAFTCLSGIVLICAVILLHQILKKVFGRDRV